MLGSFNLDLPCGPAMVSRRKSSGDPPRGLSVKLAKSMANPAKVFQITYFFHFFFKFGWNYWLFSHLAKIYEDPPGKRGGGGGGLWTISATTLLGQTVLHIIIRKKSDYVCGRSSFISQSSAFFLLLINLRCHNSGNIGYFLIH